MKLGISLPVFTSDPNRPLSVARRAADLGFDGIFSPDHLFPPAVYPRSGPDKPSLEAFSTLAAVARQVDGLNVGTLVSRVTLRPAGSLAKQAAAIDQLSGRRGILGLGAGDSASLEEHRRYGIAFPPASARLAILDETAAALRALFEGRRWPGGEHVPAMNGPLSPPGSPRIWIGGLSEAVVKIAGLRADAWNGWGLDPRGFASRVELLSRSIDHREVEATWGGIALVGRDDAELADLLVERARRGLGTDGLWVGSAGAFRGFASELEDLGCGWMVIQAAGPPDRLQLIAETLR